MAVKKVVKPKTVDIELARIKTYVHHKFELTFTAGQVYTYTEDDARILLQLKDDQQVPVFRIYKEPEPEPEVAPGEGPVNELPKGNDLSMDDLQQGGAKVPQTPKPQAVGATKPEAGITVDSDGEIDTAAGVEV